MLLLSLRPDDLLTIPGMALSIDSMRFVSSAHATLATGILTFTLVGLLPLNTSAFFGHAIGPPAPSSEGVRSSNHDRKCGRRDGWDGPKYRPQDYTRALVSVVAWIDLIRAKWRSSPSAYGSTPTTTLTEPTLLEMDVIGQKGCNRCGGPLGPPLK